MNSIEKIANNFTGKLQKYFKFKLRLCGEGKEIEQVLNIRIRYWFF